MNSILQPRCSLECCAGVTEKPQKGPAVPFRPDPFDLPGDSSVFRTAVRHRGNIVIQRSDIPLSIQNLRRMQSGNSPFVRNAAGEWEALNLHHVGRQDGKLIEIFSSHNTYNPATGGPLHIPGPGGPLRQLLPAFLMSHFWPNCDGRDF